MVRHEEGLKVVVPVFALAQNVQAKVNFDVRTCYHI